MATFCITSSIKKFYPYRTALLEASIWFELGLYEKQQVCNYLKRQGFEPNNHICWKNADGMCFALEDNCLGLGIGIIEGEY